MRNGVHYEGGWLHTFVMQQRQPKFLPVLVRPEIPLVQSAINNHLVFAPFNKLANALRGVPQHINESGS